MTHRRAEPAHRFTSRVALPLLFLDELPGLRTAHPLVDLDPSAHRRRWPAAIRFHRGDYLPSGAPTVRGAVVEAVARRRGLGAGPGGDVGPCPHLGMALQPAHLVLLLRPVGTGRRVDGARGVQHPMARAPHYVVGPPGEHTFAKAMHVSPFLPAQATYTLRYSAPGRGHQGQPRRRSAARPSPYGRGDEPDPDVLAPRLSASMVLRRRPLDRAGLARLLWAYPLMTTRVSGGIYAQAVRLAAAAPRSTGTPAGGTCVRLPAATRWSHSGSRERQMSRVERLSAPGLGPARRPGATRHLALRGQRGARAGTGRDRVR